MPVGDVFRREQERVYQQARQIFCASHRDGSESLDAACAAALAWRVPWSDRLAGALRERAGASDGTAFSFSLAEVYQRQNDDDRARAAYARLLADSPGDEVRLRLGLLAEVTATHAPDPARWRVEAEGWYRDYRNRVPTDVLALERLVVLCAVQSCRDAAALDAQWKTLSDDANIVAGLLGQTGEAVAFASSSSAVLGWRFTWLQDGLPIDARPDLVFGGHDALEFQGSVEVLRADGLGPDHRKSDGVGGAFITTLAGLRLDTPLLLTFLYKGRGCRPYDMSFSSTLIEEGTASLPDTAGAWWKAAAVIWPGQTQAELRLTNLGACQGWFADVRTRVPWSPAYDRPRWVGDTVGSAHPSCRIRGRLGARLVDGWGLNAVAI